MKSIQDQLDLGRSATSRHVALLSAASYRKGEPGLGLVEAREDPNDRKVRQVFLTEEGQDFARTLAAVL